MKIVTSYFLADSVAKITADVHTNIHFNVETFDGPMDCIRVVFEKDRQTQFVPMAFESEERWNFFLNNRWPPIARYLLRLHDRYRFLNGQANVWLDDMATQPGLVFSLTDALTQFALPDPIFLHSDAYAEVRTFQECNFKRWQERSPLVFWRGASTGYRSLARPDWRCLPRMRLCKIAARRPDLFDVGLSHVVQISDQNELADIAATGWVKNAVPQTEFVNFRSSIDIDGNTNSWPGLFVKLLLGCTVIKVTSEQRFSQWYYNDLKPWGHFIPVQSDMSDLVEKVEWIQNNKDMAQCIASAGAKFATSINIESSISSLGLPLQKFLSQNS